MIGILTRRKSFLVWDEELVIDIAGFCSNMLGLYFDGFKIPCCSNVENGKIVELLEWVLQEGVRGCIMQTLFSFMILICSAISCISRWRPSRFGV